MQMKSFIKYISLALAAAIVFVSCKKEVEPLPYYETGAGTDLTMSTSAVTLSAANAAQNVVTFSWADPKFATDTANYKYVVEIAPKGTNFANPYTITTVGGVNGSSAITGAALNNALVAWGMPFGTATDLDVRLKSSYANNNDMKVSPVSTLKVTAYAVPFTLTASANGPFSPTPLTKDNILTKLSWTVPNYGTSTVSYILEYAKTGTSFASPTTISIAVDSLQKSLTAMELYQMANTAGIALNTTGSVDVRIKATVTGTNQVSYSNTQALQISPVEMTLYLYVAGAFQSAAPYAQYLPSGNNWGWDPASAPRLASTDGINYEGYIWVPAGVGADFKIVKGNDWSAGDYGGSSGETITVDGKNYTGGHLNSSSNLSWPAVGKHYLVKVNLNDKTWYAFETNWGLIGDATAGGWDTSTPMAYDITLGQFGKWKVTTTFGTGVFKFRANDGWDINLGSQGGDNTNIMPLRYGGGNMPAPAAGSKTVLLDLSVPLKYTYTIQ